MSMSSMRTSPLSADSKPPINRKVVVLPQPLGPSSEKNSPRSMRRLMPLRTGALSYVLVSSTSSI